MQESNANVVVSLVCVCFVSYPFCLNSTGRIDRKIEFPLPDEKTKRRIFTIHTSRMTLSEDVNLEEYVMAKDDLSGADIKVWALTGIFSASGFALTKENVYRTETFASRSIEALGETILTVPLGGIMRDCACTQDYTLSLPE